MRLASKILLPLLLTLTVLAALSVVIAVMAHRQSADLRASSKELVEQFTLVKRIEDLQKATRINTLSYLLDGKEERLDVINAADRDIATASAAYALLKGGGRTQELLDEFLANRSRIIENRNELLRAALAGNTARTGIALDKWNINGNNVTASLNDLSAYSIVHLENRLRSMADEHAWLWRVSLIAVLLATLVIIATFVFVRRDVVSRLSRLTTEIEHMDSDNLTRHVDRELERSDDEIGTLAKAFNAMVARVRTSLTAIETEIAERKRAEKRLEGIFTSAMDGIVTINTNQHIMLINPAAERMFGYAAQDLLGKPLETLLPQRFREGHAAHIQGFAATGVTARAMGKLGQVWGRRANGEEFPVEASISQLGDGPERLYTAILRDVTEAKAASERQTQLLHELEASNKELESFNYSVSHDLRAPLRAADMFSNTLLKNYRDRLDEKGVHYLERISNATGVMGQLIQDLLDLSRITTSEVQRRNVDISAIALNIADELRLSEPHRVVEFRIAQGITARADPRLTRILLQNLLANAWKFTSKSANARIEIGVTQDSSGTEYFVRDNGAGFDMAHSEMLFGAFQRLHSAEEFPGTGIGLAIVKRVVTRHRGHIRAEGKVDCGSTFHFTLGGDPS